MFSENHKISQRQLKRQAVLLLLCPAFWHLTAAGAAGGFPGIGGIFCGYALLSLWCVWLVRAGGFFDGKKDGSGAEKTGRLLLTAVYLIFLVLAGGMLLGEMARVSAERLTAGISEEICALLLLVCASCGVGTDVQRRGRLAELLYAWVVTGIVVLLVLTVPQMRAVSFREAGNTARAGGWRAGGEIFLQNLRQTLESGMLLALLPFLFSQVKKEPQNMIRPLLESLWKTGVLVIAGSIALLGVFGRRGTAAAPDPLLLLMTKTSLPGNFLERFDILWLALFLTGLLFTLGSLLFYVSQIGASTGLWEPKSPAVRVGGAFLFCLSACFWNHRKLQEGPVLLIAGILVLLLVLVCQRQRKRGMGKRLLLCAVCLLGSITLCACGAVEPEKRLYPLAAAFDYNAEEKLWRVWYAPANLPVLTGQEKDEAEEGSDEEPTMLGLSGETLDAARWQYDAAGEYELDTSHIQAILFSDALLENRKKTAELLERLEQDNAIGRNIYVFHAARPEELMQKNGKEIESVGTYLCGIYDNRVKRKQAVTLSDLCYTWENAGRLSWMPEVP